MSLTITAPLLAFIVVVLLVAGVLNGIAGFGMAVVGTMALAMLIEPAVAVAFMIIPILAVNVVLVRELSPANLRSCGSRFAPLILAALGGTLVGMVVLDRLPDAPLRVLLGIVALGFVATVQQTVSLPGARAAKEGCFVEHPGAMVGVGGVSGVLFGGTNVGVQLVAYVRSCDLSHGLFVGVVALVFVGVNAIRVGAAGVLGLYPDLLVFGLSVAAILPAVIGVLVGSFFRDRITERLRRGLVLGLLTIIGVQLVLTGSGVVRL